MATEKQKVQQHARRRRCEYCHELFDKDKLEHTVDPYASDVNGDDTLHWLCSSCINVLSDEI